MLVPGHMQLPNAAHTSMRRASLPRTALPARRVVLPTRSPGVKVEGLHETHSVSQSMSPVPDIRGIGLQNKLRAGALGPSNAKESVAFQCQGVILSLVRRLMRRREAKNLDAPKSLLYLASQPRSLAAGNIP